MLINPTPIKNWKGIGWPPDTALEQYADLWHIELVLRHFIYASLRITFGSEWPEALKRIRFGEKTLFEKLQRQAGQAVTDNEFTELDVPDVLWFATTKELIGVIANEDNWATCFAEHLEVFGLTRKFFSKDLDSQSNGLSQYSLPNQRNRWAHFRPLAPEKSKIKEVIAALNKPMADWMAYKYWNSDPVLSGDELLTLCKRPENVHLPITNKTHGTMGFIDAARPLDKGFSILLKKNSSCYWAELYNVGGITAWAFDFIKQLAIRLNQIAAHIHIMLHYDLYAKSDTAREDSVDVASISLPVKMGIERILIALQETNLFLTQYKMRSKNDVGFSSEPELELSEFTKLLFYEMPFNVIVAPNQESTIAINIGVPLRCSMNDGH